VNTVIDRLREAAGPDAVLGGRAITEYSGGIWAESRPVSAAAVIRPKTPAQVAAVMAVCHAARQRVVVHGGLTGLVGATASTPADIVLSLARLNRIESIDTAGCTLTAEAGVTLEVAQRAADAAGLLLPLDMGSRGSATLGGAAATNAGGNRVLRYGMTRALVLGLEAVLADGTVVSSMNRMLKNTAGFDLKQTFIGTEGTLGVITRLVLRLVPRPTSRQTALVALDDFTRMSRLLNFAAAALGGTLSAFEAMWRSYYEFNTGPGTGRAPPLPPHSPYFVLIEAEGGDPAADDPRFEAVLARAQRDGLIADAVIAKSEREREALWTVRDDVIRLTGLRPMFIFDVSAPLVETERYVNEVQQAIARRWPESRFFTFGHLADGNLHFAICAGPPGGEDKAEVERLVYEPLQAIGGSVSAEHGIGLDKKPYLAFSRTAAEIELMRSLKRALDPRDILNPGRVVDAG
jgi:FAD/FMN-containing dehydrogenase